MKKYFTLLSMVFTAMAMNAQGVSWDFTNWSESTLDAVRADIQVNQYTNWKPYEKSASAADQAHFWTAKAMSALVTNDGSNTDTIPETKGLIFGGTGASKVVITYADAREDHPKYLWLNGGKITITAKNVVGNQKLKFAVESHNSSQARGVTVTFNGTALTSPTGNFTPKAYTEYEVDLPEGTGDLVFTTTSGCHLFYIIVGDGGPKVEPIETVPHVAYLYESTYGGSWDIDADPITTALYTVQPVNIDLATTTLTSAQLNDSLRKFDVVVLGGTVTTTTDLAKNLFAIVNKVPMLNLQAAMYAADAWNLGAVVNPENATAIAVAEGVATDKGLFESVNVDEGSVVLFDVEGETTGGLVQSYTLNEKSIFADDKVIATVDGKNAIHEHGTKNRYMLLPLSFDNYDKFSDDVTTLIINAVDVLKKTKGKVANAATPVVNQNKQDGLTTVSLTCTTPGSIIYFTKDGSEPTLESPVYSEPFDVTEDNTVQVKAFAVAHGFDQSAMADVTVSVLSKMAAPSISVESFDGYSVITLSHVAGEEANIYYSFVEPDGVAHAKVYNDPIQVTDNGTIYALADWATALPSEIVSEKFEVAGLPAIKDTVAHFLPCKADWVDSCQIYWADTLVGSFAEAETAGIARVKSSAYYHFGNSAKSYFTDEVDHEEVVKDEDGVVIKSVLDPEQDSVKVYYKVDPSIKGKVVSKTNTGWAIMTEGQYITIETAAPEHFYSKDAKDATRCADDPIDLITGGPVCKGLFDFGGKADGCAYNLRVQHTEKVAAPFCVETYLGNGSTNSNCGIEVQISADGETWNCLQQLTISETQRYWRRHKVIYEEEGSFYVRIAMVGNTSKAQLYDVLIMTIDGATGIESIQSDKVNGNAIIFDLQGRKVAKMEAGKLYIQNGKKVVVR